MLEDTIGGKLLNKLGGQGLPKGVWDVASGIFAANAKGTVKVFLSEGASYGGTFSKIEAPIIEALKNATLVFY